MMLTTVALTTPKKLSWGIKLSLDLFSQTYIPIKKHTHTHIYTHNMSMMMYVWIVSGKLYTKERDGEGGEERKLERVNKFTRFGNVLNFFRYHFEYLVTNVGQRLQWRRER